MSLKMIDHLKSNQNIIVLPIDRKLLIHLNMNFHCYWFKHKLSPSSNCAILHREAKIITFSNAVSDFRDNQNLSLLTIVVINRVSISAQINLIYIVSINHANDSVPNQVWQPQKLQIASLKVLSINKLNKPKQAIHTT